MLKRACKNLSERKQQEIAAYIELFAMSQKRTQKITEETVNW